MLAINRGNGVFAGMSPAVVSAGQARLAISGCGTATEDAGRAGQLSTGVRGSVFNRRQYTNPADHPVGVQLARPCHPVEHLRRQMVGAVAVDGRHGDPGSFGDYSHGFAADEQPVELVGVLAVADGAASRQALSRLSRLATSARASGSRRRGARRARASPAGGSGRRGQASSRRSSDSEVMLRFVRGDAGTLMRWYPSARCNSAESREQRFS